MRKERGETILHARKNRLSNPQTFRADTVPAYSNTDLLNYSTYIDSHTITPLPGLSTLLHSMAPWIDSTASGEH